MGKVLIGRRLGCHLYELEYVTSFLALKTHEGHQLVSSIVLLSKGAIVPAVAS